jgi:hypothetical protein
VTAAEIGAGEDGPEETQAGVVVVMEAEGEEAMGAMVVVVVVMVEGEGEIDRSEILWRKRG